MNAGLSDAAASDDSDIRNTAHEGTTLAAAGLAVAERVGATGQDLLLAMMIGYEAAGRIGEARRGGRGGVHASQIVAFGGAVAAAKLLRLTDEQMAHALGIAAITMGGLATGTEQLGAGVHGRQRGGLRRERRAGCRPRLHRERGHARRSRAGSSRCSVAARSRRATDGRSRQRVGHRPVPRDQALARRPPVLRHGRSGDERGAPGERAARPSGQDSRSRSRAGQRSDGSRRPKDLVEAIHSLPYFVASAVADKNFTWVHATEAKIFNPVVTRLMDLVAVDPAPPAVTYTWSWGGSVTIETTSGARFTSTVDAPRGSAPRGIEWSDVDAKYRALMPDSKLPAERIEEILKMYSWFRAGEKRRGTDPPAQARRADTNCAADGLPRASRFAEGICATAVCKGALGRRVFWLTPEIL